MADEQDPISSHLRPRDNSKGGDGKEDLMDISPTLAGESTMHGEATTESYAPEIRGGSWKIERTVDREAIQEQLDAADEEAEHTNNVMDNSDPDYVPPKEA